MPPSMVEPLPRQFQSDLAWSVGLDGEESSAARTTSAPDIRDVASQIGRLIRLRKVKIPMLPQAATEAMKLAGDPKTSFKTVERVVSTDLMLAARVLAVANSPLYGGQNVKSLALALQRLGTGTIRDVLYQAVAEAHIFRGSDGDALLEERAHAVTVGLAARAVCRRVGLDSGYAFVCGLLHDIGRPVLIELLRANPPPGLQEFELASIVDRLHPHFGAHLAQEWGLPKLVIEACRRHHGYIESEKRHYSQIGNAIAVADRIAILRGFGREFRPLPLHQDRAYFDLGLTPADVEDIMRELELQSANR